MKKTYHLRRLTLCALLGVAFFVALQFTANAYASPPQTTVVILGVSHSQQLVAQSYQPAVFRAFFDRVNPVAICIERSPDEFMRGDLYEFTYEQQFLTVPYTREHHIPIFPVDWLPSHEDSQLAFGVSDLEQPPFLRPSGGGFQSFVTFDDPADLKQQLFYSESAAARRPAREWAAKPAAKGSREFARRLFLYRTYLQAMRIEKVAQRFPGKTVLVVIGSMHKDDLENTISADSNIQLVQPSSFGMPTPEAVQHEIELDDYFAIATFNLLGLQADTENLDFEWLQRIVKLLRSTNPTPETALFETRLRVLRKEISPEQAIMAYRGIADHSDPMQRFTFTGVKYTSRIDSYFDPFGNLTVRQRVLLEEAREAVKAKQSSVAAKLKRELLANPQLSPKERAQLDAYWDRFLSAG